VRNLRQVVAAAVVPRNTLCSRSLFVETTTAAAFDRDDWNVQRELCGRKMNTLIVGRSITGLSAFI
jgi:hypothetical protein